MSALFSRRVEIVTDFLNSIGNMNFDRVEQHLADDAVMIAPFVDEMPPMQSRSAIVNQLRSTVPQMFERMNFTCDEWYDVGDADALIAEYHSECPLKGNGGTYRNTYITVVRFDGDRISLFKEYLNPQRMMVLMPSIDGS
jgi:ketosteroid isomerase-like protein